MTVDTGEEQYREDRTQKARKYKKEGREGKIGSRTEVGVVGVGSGSGGQCLLGCVMCNGGGSLEDGELLIRRVWLSLSSSRHGRWCVVLWWKGRLALYKYSVG